MSRHRRALFDEDADLYDRARPGYPDALFADLVDLAGVVPGSRIVEVGPGTGQATLKLADLGAVVTAVELGPALARVLAGKVGSRNIEVVVSPFEDWRPALASYDALVAFTAWHWLDRVDRASRAAHVLRPGGALATVTAVHVADGAERFFAEAQLCYERWDPATPPVSGPPMAKAVGEQLDEIDRSPLFEAGTRRRYSQTVQYTTSEYLDLLDTFSNHRALDAEVKAELFACLRELINERHSGIVAKRYLYELRVARVRCAEPARRR